jgi:hypothetical protein
MGQVEAQILLRRMLQRAQGRLALRANRETP